MTTTQQQTRRGTARRRAAPACAAAIAAALFAAGCSQSAPDDGASEQAATAEPGAGRADESGRTPTPGETSPEGAAGDASDAGSDDLADASFDVSWTRAVEIAQEAFSGDLISLELERERDGFAYTVELVSGDEEFEALVDASSGEIVRHETDRIDGDDAPGLPDEVIDPSGLIAPEEAVAAALGEADGVVVSWSLDRSWSGTHYEVEIERADGRTVEIEVDAETGAITEVDD